MSIGSLLPKHCPAVPHVCHKQAAAAYQHCNSRGPAHAVIKLRPVCVGGREKKKGCMSEKGGGSYLCVCAYVGGGGGEGGKNNSCMSDKGRGGGRGETSRLRPRISTVIAVVPLMLSSRSDPVGVCVCGGGGEAR
jgi:hypothetical protein